MSRKRILRNVLLIITSVMLLVGFVIAWIVGGKLVAPANRPVAVPADLPIVEFEIASESGTNVAGWSLSHESSTAVVLLLHPLRANRTAMLGRARLLFENGFSVVMIDFQAHGESPGENITLGYLEKYDVEALVDYTRTAFPERKIGIVGWSLGGASALLASPLDVDAIVLESVYPTVSHAVYDRIDMRLGLIKYVAAPSLTGQLPLRLGISSNDLRPIDFIANTDCPMLILAGDKDLHTPIEESRLLFDAAIEPKELVIFSGACHEDLLRFDRQLYRDKAMSFLAKHLSLDSN